MAPTFQITSTTAQAIKCSIIKFQYRSFPRYNSFSLTYKLTKADLESSTKSTMIMNIFRASREKGLILRSTQQTTSRYKMRSSKSSTSQPISMFLVLQRIWCICIPQITIISSLQATRTAGKKQVSKSDTNIKYKRKPI
jgi:hypothetical protein